MRSTSVAGVPARAIQRVDLLVGPAAFVDALGMRYCQKTAVNVLLDHDEMSVRFVLRAQRKVGFPSWVDNQSAQQSPHAQRLLEV